MIQRSEFLSTLPARGATRVVGAQPQGGQISIHAPREGSDDIADVVRTGNALFLSTLPARGATPEE